MKKYIICFCLVLASWASQAQVSQRSPLFSNGFVESSGGNFKNLSVVGLPIVGKAVGNNLSTEIHFAMRMPQDSSAQTNTRATHMSLSPNPVANQLKIVLDNYQEQRAVVRVLHVSGKEVLKTSVSKQDNTIDLTKLRPGLYILEVTQGKYKGFRRILKQ